MSAPRRKKKSKQRWKNREIYFIDDDLQQRNKKGMQLVLNKLNLVLGPQLAELTGSRPLEEKSMKTYQTYFRGMIFFLSLVGDYESMLILQKCRPKFCPSIHPERISQFITFKRSKKGDLLCDSDGNPVLNVYGHQVTCQGGWNDPDCVKSMKSALSALHTAAENCGQFNERCEDCLTLDSKEQYHGCSHHRMKPQIWQKGDPFTTQLLKNAIKTSHKEGSTYVTNGDSPLSPWEVDAMRQKLVSSNKIEDLQLFVIILIAIKLFLRSDEFLAITGVQILWDLTLINDDNSIESLAIQIQGKTDVRPVVLMLHSDPRLPELCPVKFLMLYLSLINYKCGFLFPNLNAIKTRSGVFTNEADVMDYSYFLDRFVKLCKSLFKRSGPFGTHTCRKTAYLFAIWGGAPDDEMMKAARHKSLKTAMKYKRDASLLHHLAMRKNYMNFISLLPTWCPIYVEELQMAREIVDENNFKSIPQYLEVFVRDILKMSLNSPHFNQPNALRKMLLWKRNVASHEELHQVLSGMKDKVLSQSISSLVARVLKERTTPTVNNDDDENIPNDPPTADLLASLADVASSSSAHQPLKKKRKKREDKGDNDLTRRSQLSKFTGMERLNLLLELHDEAIHADDLTERARTYVSQNITPVVNCFEHHFQSNKDEFIKAWKTKNFRYTKFAQLCNKKSCGLGAQT